MPTPERITQTEFKGMKPHTSVSIVLEEIMQITLAPGEWIQVAMNVGGAGEPCYEIVQLAVTHGGKVEVRGNVGMTPWHHDAVCAEG